MKKKHLIKRVIREFHLRDNFNVIKRDIQIPLDSQKVVTLIGSRRVGKTSIFYDLINDIAKNGQKEKVVFINFEDERLNLRLEELDLILEAYSELYPQNPLSECYFFFDEIQNIDGWERFVRRVYDNISKKVFITGSNSKLLSSDIASSLRGRGLKFEIYPLSFKEFLKFKNIEYELYTLSGLSKIKLALKEYLTQGGFPELVFIDKIYHTEILQDYFDVMIYKDLIERYDIKNITALKFFLKKAISSSTKELSVNKIYNTLKSNGIKIGKNSLYEYLEYIQNIYLAFLLPKYSFKANIKELGEKKIYAIDFGLVNAIDYSFSQNLGKALENALFLELKRKKLDFFYYKEGSFEIDFLINRGDFVDMIQVSYDLSDKKTLDREIKAFILASKRFKIKSCTIVSFEYEDIIEKEGLKIEILPFYKWIKSF